MRFYRAESKGFRVATRRLLLAIVAVLALVAASSPASAADDQSWSSDLILLHADEGTVVEIARFDVDPELVGQTCVLEVSVINQKSVNPGNDVVVAIGGAQMTLSDVEAVQGVVTSTSAPVTAGPDVTFTLIMGPRRVFSAYMSAELVCEPPPPPTVPPQTSTTTTTTTTTTTAAVVPASSTTTTTTTTTTVPVGDVAPSPPAVPVQGQPIFTG